VSTAASIASSHIDDEYSNAVIRSSKNEEFVEILKLENMELEKVTQNGKRDAYSWHPFRPGSTSEAPREPFKRQL
jgi:hypothetical protein